MCSSADERYLHSDPQGTRDEWCAVRCDEAERRLEQAAIRYELVLINHFPLRQELVRFRRIPRFSLWCGIRRTEDWHRRFRARVVISGHLHMHAPDWIDGVRFEEVSLGYPRHWNGDSGIESYLREIRLCA